MYFRNGTDPLYKPELEKMYSNGALRFTAELLASALAEDNPLKHKLLQRHQHIHVTTPSFLPSFQPFRYMAIWAGSRLPLFSSCESTINGPAARSDGKIQRRPALVATAFLMSARFDQPIQSCLKCVPSSHNT